MRLILIFQSFIIDLTSFFDSSRGKKMANKNQTTYRPKQDMVGGSKISASRKNRSQVFSSSNSKRPLRTISRPTRRNNRRPAKSPTTESIPDTYSDESDTNEMADESHHQSMQPVASRTRSRKDPNYNYKQYLARLIRKMNERKNEPNLTISSKAMECMTDFMTDIFDKIAKEASQQIKRNKGKTLGDWDLKSAVKILMPGDLGKHANMMGYNALQKMKAERMDDKKNMVFDPKTGCICPMY